LPFREARPFQVPAHFGYTHFRHSWLTPGRALARLRHFVAVALAAVVLAFGLTRAEPTAPVPADPFGYQLPKDVHYVGNLSCAAASCHAAGHSAGTAGSEYTTWAGSDPHFRAYDVLKEPRSRKMVELLHGTTPAHRDRRCLSCHAPEAALADPPRAQGVGCESCHGPAERWLTAHYQAEFKSLSRREKAERYGLYPTKDLAFRVTLCASCHVGDAGREVDHDLIAAGHPRLAFEYTGYHHDPKYFRHWTERAPDFDARAWEIGQVACARSAARLLSARARNGERAWPELSEYSCFACHKDLHPEKPWKPLTATDRAPGTLPWGTWYFSAFPEQPADVKRLAKLMESPAADRRNIPVAADELANRLDARLRELQADADRGRPYTTADVADRFHGITASALTPDGRFRDLDWDGVTQHYLGAAAYYYAWGSLDPAGRDTRFRPLLDGIADSLRFPKGYNSPAGTDPARLLDLFRRLRTRDPHP
jgi:cytochrome c554/c'-like protein